MLITWTIISTKLESIAQSIFNSVLQDKKLPDLACCSRLLPNGAQGSGIQKVIVENLEEEGHTGLSDDMAQFQEAYAEVLVPEW